MRQTTGLTTDTQREAQMITTSLGHGAHSVTAIMEATGLSRKTVIVRIQEYNLKTNLDNAKRRYQRTRK